MLMVTIVIPVYKALLNEHEIISLKQCVKILGNYKICIVTHKNLDIQYYKSIHDFDFEYFESLYFASIVGYNQLMLSKTFYERFSNSNYILIYQLDAYVFKDELEYWCKKGYDYIGAPWLPKEISIMASLVYQIHRVKLLIRERVLNPSILYRVGNGGLSLRKVDTCINVLVKSSCFLMDKYMNNGQKSKFTEYKNEDIFWSFEAKKLIKFTCPNYIEALSFAIDSNPNFGINKINNLPFGVHGWSKPDSIEFWFKHIQIYTN